MWNVLYVVPIVFFIAKSDYDVKLNLWLMIFISEIISIIIQKNRLCTNKIRVFCFYHNCINFLSQNPNFCPPACAPMVILASFRSQFQLHYFRSERYQFQSHQLGTAVG